MEDIELSIESIRLRIKQEISSNGELYKRIAVLETYGDIYECLLGEFSQLFKGYSIHSIISELSAEILKLRAEPGHYLVDSEGKTLFKITEDMLYQPPPVVGEDGIERQPGLKLHPKISSGIALAYHETDKIRKLEKKYPNTKALDHIRKPDSIGMRTLEILEKDTHIKTSLTEEEFTEHFIKIGRENIEGVFQSFNPDFYRVEVFANSLAKSILRLEPSRVQIISIERKNDTKYSWFEAHVLTQ